jgi:hypothetical protein
LSTNAARKEKLLGERLGEREAERRRLDEVVADAQALGSLELAGFRFSWDEIRAGRLGVAAPEPALRLQRAQTAVARDAPLGWPALHAWREALGAAPGLRQTERSHVDGPPPAPSMFVESRLVSLFGWLEGDSGRELRPPQAGALVLARLLEILPFEDQNGRVARLATSHVMVRGGAGAPVLVGADRERLEAALAQAFRLETEPLAALLQEASERALDVMLQALERGL